MTTTTHLGPIGSEVEATGRVIVARPSQSRFHPSMLVILALDDGSRVKAFCKAESDLAAARVGEVWTITGRVKAHETITGTAQTFLNRAKGWDPEIDGNTRCTHCGRSFDAGGTMLTECGRYDCPGVV